MEVADGVSENTSMENMMLKPVAFIYKSKEKNLSVKEDKPVIHYAKTIVDSENIVVYSSKLEALISPYVPCSALREGETIEIITRKRLKKETILSSLQDPNYNVGGKGTFFKVQCKGYTEGGAPKKILDDKHSWENKPLAVYGEAHHTIEEAILNDKRLCIKYEFNLKNPNKSATNENNIQLSFLDPDVVYTIQLTNSKRPTTKPDCKTEKYKPSNRSDKTSKDKVSQNTEFQAEDPQTSSVPRSEHKVHELPEIYRTPKSTTFSSSFNNLSNSIGGRELRESIIKNHNQYKRPMPADTFKSLNRSLESVALLRCTNSTTIKEIGTFFLLSETLGLTCYHVLKESLISENHQHLSPKFSVIFNYDNESDEKVEYNAYLECHNENLDIAFLRISKPEKGLLQYVAPPPQEGSVSIIGHPKGLYKKIDPICSVINFSKRAEQILSNILSDRSYIHVLTEQNLMLMSQPELVTYDTCLYWGASGSPVFNDQGQLVAMHTGGYAARTDLEKESIIEYGRNIIDILICGAIHLPELCLWFRGIEKQNSSLCTYLKDYTSEGRHSVCMQPFIRLFLQSLHKDEMPQCQNPDDSGIAECLMDISL
ncbi:uncharacterized protein [Pyxicephalus adspersus]